MLSGTKLVNERRLLEALAKRRGNSESERTEVVKGVKWSA